MKNPVLYGISNCDTVRKARAWLSSRAVPYEFHDFKKSGVPPQALAHWLQALGDKELVNRRGTTWRQLDRAEQAALTCTTTALPVLLRHPSAIRRPVVEWPNGDVTVGFDPTDWEKRSKNPSND
ncbi:Spx/MgsR family RNA polymerase-binding regulatory protein [Simplicispira suum]|uniref:Arsenate reductase n=1 Tax=Simplicispira suum TaxID=2109915 RepID=A0A2S0MVW0_9BURK|nr:Spx/MgsR family RNA polymerase-binding regulatory protein [Simplicispira suum]AVO40026.1 arsenate reductase [Simplicispira suum]MBW7833937.1 Spx/MgsR family RNA polymerase-binding regulatory protein [Simplicispira suum]